MKSKYSYIGVDLASETKNRTISELVLDEQINVIVSAITKVEEDRLKENLCKCMEKFPEHTVQFKNDTFTTSPNFITLQKINKDAPDLGKKDSLHIRKLMEEYNIFRVNDEYIKSVFKHALILLNSNQDMRDMFPDVCIGHINELSSINRTREAGFIFAGKPALEKRFLNACERFEYYVANQFLFS